MQDFKLVRRIAAIFAVLIFSGSAFADPLDDWRLAVTTARLLAENDVQRAYAEGMRLQESIPDTALPIDRIRVLNLLSRVEVYGAMTELAEKHSQQAQQLAMQSHDKAGQAEALLNVALNSVNQAKIETSLSAITRSVELLDGVYRSELLGEAMLRMSMMYRRQGDLDNSVTLAMQAMELARRSNNAFALTYAHQGLAISFEQGGDYEKAYSHYQQMRDQARLAHSKMLEAHAVQGMAGVLPSLGRDQAGEQLLWEAIALYRELHTPFGLNFGLYGMADRLSKHGHYEAALNLLNEVVATYEKYPNRIGMWFTLNERSRDLQALHRMAAAKLDAQKGAALAEEIGLPLYIGGSARRLSEIAGAEGDFRLAYQYSVKAAQMSDKTVSDKASARMIELTNRYETESKQRRIDELTRHNEQQAAQKRWLMTVLGGSVLLLGLTVFFIVRLRRSREEIRVLNIGLERRVQERTAELRQQARYMRTLIDMLPMWAWLKDTQSRYLAVNQSAAEAFGLSADEMLGKSDFELFAWDVAILRRDEDIALMASMGRRMSEEKSGEVWMENYKATVLDEDGSVLGTVGVARDISARKMAEAAREAALTEAERLASARSEFLAQMSHELRTPLNGILGYAQILARDKKLDERQLAGVGVIRQSGEHLLTLINDILDFAKIDAGKMELVMGEVKLESFLRVISGIMRIKADEKRLEFVCEVDPAVPTWIRVDEKRLRQVLLNLLSNAVKFTARGRVSLRVVLLSSQRVRFEVRDTGIGIPAHQLHTIFQPFEQAGEQRHRYGGTGLGLPISRQLVRMMGGDIRVESRVDQGSVFLFDLDAGRCNEILVQRRHTVTGYAGERKTILVVDDTAESCYVEVQMLEEVGFNTMEAANGVEALLKIQATRPDLILMDSVMPEMDGPEAIRRLRCMAGFEDIPVISVSASASVEDERRCLDAGANLFLPKPIDFVLLFKHIAILIDIDWRYEGGEVFLPDELIVPPPDEMSILHHLAQSGNIREMSRRSRALIEQDSRYRIFGERLYELAQGYQTRAILNFIEQYL